MQVPQIRMKSQMGQIAIETKNAEMHIEQPKAELSIQQPHAEVNMRTKPAKLTIDQTEAFADMNLMSILRRNDLHADEGMQAISEGTARRAREGRELMEIENGGNPIKDQAKRNSGREMKPLGITFIPSRFSVKIDYEPVEVEIDVTANKPIIEAKTYQRANLKYVPGSVETTLKQRPELDIWFVNLTV